MDFCEEYEKLKVSALSKAKSINKYVKNVTLGPNSSPINNNNNENQTKILEKNEISPLNQKTTFSNKRSPLGKMLVEVEAQIRDEIRVSVRSRLDKILAASKELDEKLKSQWNKKQQALMEQSQQHEELMLKILEEHDRRANDHLQQMQIHYQKQAEERNKRNQELQKKEKQRQELLILIEFIQKQQLQFRLLYQEIVGILKNFHATDLEKNSTQLTNISNATLKLKMFLESMEKIKDKCKAGVVTKDDLESSATIVREVTVLKEIIQIIVTQKPEVIQRNEEVNVTDTGPTPPKPTMEPTDSKTALKPQLSLPKTQLIAPNSHLNLPNLDKSTPAFTFGTKSCLKLHSTLQTFLESYRNSFAQLSTDPRLKQFRFHCQKAVNIPLNAISAVNAQHLLDKYQRLTSLLRGNRVEAGGTSVTPSQHPQGIAYCTDLLARKFVLQGDLLISSNPEAAHCYAAMIVALWHDFPDFGRLVLAYFYGTAPYLVPFYPPKIEGQSDKEHYKSLGYSYVDDEIERQDKFLKRMAGIMRLYSAVMVSKLRRSQQGAHPQGLVCAWRWLANVLNLEPRSDVTATVLLEFLEVTGSAMQAAYGNQFKKILIYINDVYLDKMQKIDSGGPVSRVEAFLNKVKKHGIIEPPKGRLSEGFW